MLEWLKHDSAPELGESLTVPPEGFEGVWWAAMAEDGSSLYAFVCGDGGKVPLSLTLYCVPEYIMATDHTTDRKTPDRYPTLPEIWECADRFALPGALLMPCGVHDLPAIACAGVPPPPVVVGEGRAFQMAQAGALPNSAALRRMQFAGSAPPQRLIIEPGG